MSPFPLSSDGTKRDSVRSGWPDFFGFLLFTGALAIAYHYMPGVSWMRRVARFGPLTLQAGALWFSTALLFEYRSRRDAPVDQATVRRAAARAMMLWLAVATGFAVSLLALLDLYERLGMFRH